MARENNASQEHQIDPCPQLENGYVKIANEIFDALCRTRIPGEERQILDTIIRKTWGFNKKSDSIPLTQFEAITGIDRKGVCRAINSLEEKGMISVKKATSNVTTYCINKICSKWSVVAKKPRGKFASGKIDDTVVANLPHSKDIFSKDNKDSLRDDGFSTFWETYPRKVGKAASAKSWAKLHPPLEKVLKTLSWQISSDEWVKDAGK